MGVLFRIREPAGFSVPEGLGTPENSVQPLYTCSFSVASVLSCDHEALPLVWWKQLKKVLFQRFMCCMRAACMCACAPPLCLGPIEPEKELDTLALELRMILSCYMGLGDKSKF